MTRAFDTDSDPSPADDAARPSITDDAVTALSRGEAVVYPTETVYGLAASATDADAVSRLFELKGRDRSKPISVAFPDLDTARRYTNPTAREHAFMEAFLPGPVTVLVDRGDDLPAVVNAGNQRVGVRVPDCSLARELARRAGPITATSANESGSPSVRTPDALSSALLANVAVVIDAGETPGTESSVVDVASETIHRRGALVDEIETWFATH